MVAKRGYITDYIGLDLMRFLLSLAVVLRHYYCFYYRLANLGSILRTQPYYNILGVFYKYGHYSVQVFWLISGIIFQTIYFEDIAAANIGFEEFTFLRLTRLYPLHVVTLLLVTVLQFVYLTSYHTFFVYQTEDLRHFLMQLLFMGSWYPHFEHSYNIPVWSVSIEIFVYIIFFLLALAGVLGRKGIYFVVALTIIFNIFGILNPFGECLTFFFCGCLLARSINKGTSLQILLVKIWRRCFGLLRNRGVGSSLLSDT
jgi:peptidoglycan/LPS O-acetylase OafA/YrhL